MADGGSTQVFRYSLWSVRCDNGSASNAISAQIFKTLGVIKMTKYLRTLLIFGLFTFFGCAPRTYTTDGKLPIVDLCDLPKYTNQKVYLKCEYSGAEEYWNLSSIENQSCGPQLLVDLDFVDDYDQMRERFRKKLRQVHHEYPISKLYVEAIGVYETEKGHYGHLGSNKSRFLISEIRKMDVVKK